jgi:hypothetical protein
LAGFAQNIVKFAIAADLWVIQWNADPKCRTVSDLAFHAHCAVMHFDNPFGNGQTQARATLLT